MPVKQQKNDNSYKAGFSTKITQSFYKLTQKSLKIDLTSYFEIVENINNRNLRKESDKGLLKKALKLKSQIQSGVSLDQLIAEAFALVKEASHRHLGLDPFPVQMVAGIVLHQGKIAELPTGEGKTLAAVFPAFLNALSGKGVHILTVNDYLARRDAEWMNPIYKSLGISVGVNQEGQSIEEKKDAYRCDITYSTAKEAGFDFLRDHLCFDLKELIHRPFSFALVDEADSILIDESRIPLVIASLKKEDKSTLFHLSRLINNLNPSLHFNSDSELRNIYFSDEGIAHLEKELKCENLFSQENIELLTALNCALHAEVLLNKDKDYIVRNGKIEIVDEFTGRVADNRHWPDGLQAAVEAKENIAFKSEGNILGTITLSHFFRLYPKLCGMTATAGSSCSDFDEFYGKQTVVIPSHKPCIRKDKNDSIYLTKKIKTAALLKEIKKQNKRKRPVLIGTASVKESEELAEKLKKDSIPFEVLNAKNDEKEAQIIAKAGNLKAVTISTNMAGRGTDIKLGGYDEKNKKEVSSLGGLIVLGTNRHESLRIDNQLRGRSGRQGDPGSSHFFISLEDDLFVKYGIKKFIHSLLQKNKFDSNTLLNHPLILREINHAQNVVEGQNREIRKTLWKYSSLVEDQRQRHYKRRSLILSSNSSQDFLKQNDPPLYKKLKSILQEPHLGRLERKLLLFYLDRCWAEHLAFISDLKETVHLVKVGGRNPLEEFQNQVTESFLSIKSNLKKRVLDHIGKLIESSSDISSSIKDIKGPSSTWTYLINDEQFSWGLEMIGNRNIGYASGAALYLGPIFLLLGFYHRYSKKRKKE